MEKGIIYVYFNRAKYEKEGIEKYYVGQTIGTMEQRAGKDGRRYGWDDSNCNSKFARSIRKWGWDAFEGRVLEEVYEEDLNELEKFYIEQFDSFKNGYNTTLGGEGTRGYKFTKKQSENCSKGQKKRYESEDERRLTSNAIKKHFKDNPNSSKLISKKAKERYENEDERAKLGKKCYCKELNLYFPYVSKATKILKELGMSGTGAIKYACNGTYSYAGTLKNGTKLTWKYIDEDNEYEMIKYNEFIKNSEEYYNNLKESKIEFMKTNEIISNNSSGTNNGRAMSCYCNELKICFSYVNLGKKYCRNILGIKIGYIPGVCYGNKKYSGVYNGTKLTWNWLEDVDEETLKNATYIDDEKYNELISKNVNDCNKKERT